MACVTEMSPWLLLVLLAGGVYAGDEGRVPVSKAPEDAFLPPRPLPLPDMSNRSLAELARGYPAGKGPGDFLPGLETLLGWTVRAPAGQKWDKPWADIYRQVESACAEREDAVCSWTVLRKVKYILDTAFYRVHPYTQDRRAHALTWELLSLAHMFYTCGTPDSRAAWEGCPSACKDDPCAQDPHALGECQTDDQVAGHQTCECQDDFEWNKSAGSCVSTVETLCADVSRSPCYPPGTEECESTARGHFCRCTPSHMGETCAEPRNPCQENYNPGQQPGNQFCGAHAQCVPSIGSNSFRCDCAGGSASCPQPPPDDDVGFPTFNDVRRPDDKPESEAEKGSNTTVIVIVCLLVGVIIAGSIVAVMRGKKEKAPENAEEQAVPLMKVTSNQPSNHGSIAPESD